MEFPEFTNDDEMARWFETRNVSAADLEPEDDLVISPDLIVSVSADLYTVVDLGRNRPATAASTMASETDANQELTPV